MRRLVSSAGALAADRAAEQTFGYPPSLLMEEAGIRLQDRLETLEADGAWPAGPVAYLVGPGNNGGDALVMARHAWLRSRRPVVLVQILPPRSPSCVLQAERADALGLVRQTWPSPEAGEALRRAVVWVDGIWGTGLAGALRPEASRLLADLESLRSERATPVVALDVPSGLWQFWEPGNPVLAARWTLAPGWLKDFCFLPEARPLVGSAEAVPLAFPQAAEPSADLLDTGDLAALVPRINPSSHKGTRGHVAVFGGSSGMTGAAVLAARSAAAAGAGLVSVGTDADCLDLIAPQVPAFQVRPSEDLLASVTRYRAWVAGPGWGRGPRRVEFLARLWATDLPLVVDADALAAWADLNPSPRLAPVVLTPHPGEFARIAAGAGSAVDRAGALARDRRVTVVLKGAVTWILGPDGRRSVWDGANPALGTGGSGDCLAGVVGAMLAAGLDGYDAARAAVALHGAAGRTLADEEGWFTADRLPEALARISLACRTGSGEV